MQRDGVPLPEVIAQQPTLPLTLLCFLEAFYELDTERSHAQGSLSRIPWSSIIGYARHYGMDEDETLFFIRSMDDAHLENLAAQIIGGDGGRPAGTRTVVQRPPRPD